MAEFVPLIFVQGGVSGNGSDHEIETPADFQNHLEQLQTGVNQKKQGTDMGAGWAILKKKKRLEMFDSKAFMKMVRGTGFEPVTPCVWSMCSTTELTARVWDGENL